MHNSLDQCLGMFEQSGWIKCSRPDLADCPIKCNPFKAYYVCHDDRETHIYTCKVILVFTDTKLSGINPRT